MVNLDAPVTQDNVDTVMAQLEFQRRRTAARRAAAAAHTVENFRTG